MSAIGEIPSEIVDKVANAMRDAPAKDLAVQTALVFNQQQELRQFIDDVGADVSPAACDLIASLGVFVYRCFEAWLGEGCLPFIPYSELEDAVMEHVEILHEVAGCDDPEAELVKRVSVSHLALVRRVGEEVLGPGGKGARLDPAEANAVFVVAKSIIDALDRCLAWGEATGIPRVGRPVEGIYQVKVTLQHVRPPVWRRVLVQPDMPLDEFHVALQIAMGWSDHHMHGFRIRAKRGQRRSWIYLDEQDERMLRLCDVLQREKDAIFYEYDFGDGWEHRIVLEKILPPDPGRALPVCIKGKRACPPEDCGGPWRYAEMLKAHRDPGHLRHDAAMEWMGPDWDPEAFDIEEVNAGFRAWFADPRDQGETED